MPGLELAAGAPPRERPPAPGGHGGDREDGHPRLQVRVVDTVECSGDKEVRPREECADRAMLDA